MIDARIPLEDVLESCTVGGWESVGKDLCGLKFGWFEKGVRADIIALETDPRQDKLALRKVDFVMKDAHVWKNDGVAVNMIQDTFIWPEKFRV
jgi:imidazolonepropionase-like amidohydrolase